jgi:hypothetical protein
MPSCLARREVLQPSEAPAAKAVLVERGSFRPVTQVNLDMLRCACRAVRQEPAVQGKELVLLMEITMNNLLSAGDLDAGRLPLARVDLLGEIGLTVLISNYSEYYRLTSYFRRYTKEMIGVAMGINNLLEVFNEKYYETCRAASSSPSAASSGIPSNSTSTRCGGMPLNATSPAAAPGLGATRPGPGDASSRPTCWSPRAISRSA